MEKNSTVGSINKYLRIYGKNQYDDPIFRVVFADEQTEKRQSVFNDFHGDLFLRTVYETREVKKYPWIKRKWILERWAPGELSYHPDLSTDKNGVYICVYIFQDKNSNYLSPLLKVCEIIIKQLLHPRRMPEALAQDKEIYDKEEKTEVDKILDKIKEDHEETQTQAETSSISLYVEKKRGKK
jgi:hypothetical protein